MKNKFTYFEFQMYLLPGALFTVSLFIMNWAFAFVPAQTSALELLGSLVFLFLSFIFGQVIQTRAHEEPERRLKRDHWDNLFPSQRMFFPWDKPHTPIISEDLRGKLLEICVAKQLLTQEERSQCDHNQQTKALTGKVQTAFVTLRYSLLGSDKASARIETAEAHYQAFRGLFVSAFWSACLALLGGAAAIALEQLVGYTAASAEVIAGLILWGSLNLFLWRVFRWRCRGAAQGFAREVARAALTL